MTRRRITDPTATFVEEEHVRARVVKGWVFENLPADEITAIRRFLDTGLVSDLPERRRRIGAKFATGELQ